MSKTIPQIPFGAVYFRKSNPPKADWSTDYRTAAEDSLNVFRHWFMWGAIERSPGVYDWSDYDRQLDLAAENGLKTVVAEFIQSVPDWAMRRFSHARQRRADGSLLSSNMGPSSATGGFASSGGGALSLYCPDVKNAAGEFLQTMVQRYKGHPGLWGYDVWNECNYSDEVDYSDFGKAAFRDWLKIKYASLDELAEAWYRYSYSEWEDIEPPTVMAPYPECLDWLAFKREYFYDLMQWRIDTIRQIDSDCLIAAHGIAGAIQYMASNGSDDWLAASKVQTYGYTWIAARKGNQPWRNFYCADITRSASRGKPFWHAERQGGPLWMQPQVLDRDREDGRVADPEDIRLWTMTSFAGGARGVLNLRWRPLLDGPLFGAFGSYGMDGSRTARSVIASDMAKWSNDAAQKSLFNAQPVRGEIGLLIAPETQQFDYLLNHQHDPTTYRAAMWGAYRGFFDNNIQADWVHIDDIDSIDTLYCAYPIMLTAGHAAALAQWVKAGGTLISEACIGYFGDRGKVGTLQPNNGLDTVFGVTESDVEIMPDIGDRTRFSFAGDWVMAGGFLQCYALAGGQECGRHEDGRLAVVEHTYGQGRSLLVGSQPSISYFRHSTGENRRFFSDVFTWSGGHRHLRLSDNELQARIHTSIDGEAYLWLLNPTRKTREVRVSLGEQWKGRGFSDVHWGGGSDAIDGDTLTVGARDALIVSLS